MEYSSKILLVEGDTDKSLFEKICKNLSLDASVLVAVPKDLAEPDDLDGKKNSKQGVFQRLELLLRQLNDGTYTHIAIVVDADYSQCNGLGFQRTIDKVSEIVRPYAFELDENSVHGICYKNTEGLADFGLWIMPDNQNEGMLEDWIKSCVKESEQELFQQVVAVVEKIPEPKFSEHSKSKAEVATWLAWQKKPGHGLYHVIKDGFLQKEHLLKVDHPLFKELEQWLIKVFADLPE